MQTIRSNTCRSRKTYSSLALIDLVENIIASPDNALLQEFHQNRPLFSGHHGKKVVFSEYLRILRQEFIDRRKTSHLRDITIADIAYDMTLDKFWNSPLFIKNPTEKKIAHQVKEKGSDYRLYFMAFIQITKGYFTRSTQKNAIEAELQAGRILENFVKRHFRLSCLEALRKLDPHRSRYKWELPHGNIWVWLPVSLNSQERRPFLEKLFPNKHTLTHLDKELIQQTINQALFQKCLYPMDGTMDTFPAPSVGKTADDDFSTSLAQAVADEKTANISKQRPAIKSLGVQQLHQLIIRIFQDLDAGELVCCRLADEFSLSTGTFSRFAGNHWHDSNKIPDLWLNTAELLSTHTAFIESAQETGFLQEARRITQQFQTSSDDGGIE